MRRSVQWTWCAGALAAVIGLGLVAAPSGARAADDDIEEPDEDWVWEDGDVVDKATYEGFYRPRERPGYAWTEGHYEQNGAWVPADFRPAAPAPQPDHVWEPGFRGSDGYFVVGTWRPHARAGFVWVPAHWDRHLWVAGHWRPVDERGAELWVPGHWTHDGHWVDGHWREKQRAGNLWVDGHWRWGRWVPGYWKPARAKAGHVWVGGYWGQGGWVDGSWRPARRAGHTWQRSRWDNGRWVVGGWVPGRPAVVRVHPRVKPVATMVRARAAYRHAWKAGVRHEIRREHRQDVREHRQDVRQKRH